MSADRSIMQGRQRDAFRVGMAATCLTMKQVAHRMGRNERTVRTWAEGSAEMPLDALGAFARTFPADATALLLDDGLAVVCLPEGVDHDDFAARCLDFVGQLGAARHPESEAGPAIGPGEAKVLGLKRAGFQA